MMFQADASLAYQQFSLNNSAFEQRKRYTHTVFFHLNQTHR